MEKVFLDKSRVILIYLAHLFIQLLDVLSLAIT